MPIRYFPQRMQPPLMKLKQWGLTDGFALLLLGVGIFLRGAAYTNLFPPLDNRHPAEEFMPIEVWGCVWMLIGIVCMAGAVFPSSQVARWGMTAAVGLLVLWGVSYIGDSIVDHDPRRWTQSLNFLTIAFMTMWTVWRGYRRKDVEGEERV
ncbi:hypothetical protein [Corynebacterium macginleyi]|uniref:hypothetical protein n=1 Tax=Corynebacterium macginleyi TaxID=38290 RepID=UPI00190AF3FB|nr:hypothetical protein [Corynebacterium macginleyi]MBK4161034.1 hypothetical protein [Corynebacterium macginleyi]